MIIHTPAIVCRSVDFQESSKIVTLFTEKRGKLAVMARGAKKPKSKFSGIIEPASLLDTVFYFKESRSVQILTEASLLDKTVNLRTDFLKMSVATSTIEMITQMVHEGEVNKPLFDFTRNFLKWLNETGRDPAKIFPYVQIRLASILGIGLQLKPGSGHADYFFNLESGDISVNSHSSYSYKLTKNQFEYIGLGLQARSSRLLDINFKNGELKQLVEHLDRYFKFHIDGFKDRKSDAIFEQIMQE